VFKLAIQFYRKEFREVENNMADHVHAEFTRKRNLLHDAYWSCRWGWEHVSELRPPTGLLFIPQVMIMEGSQGRSISIVLSGYGQEDRAIEVRSPAEARDFSSSLCVQTGSGAHSVSCTMGTVVPFLGGKTRPRRDADHSPHLVPRSWMSRSCTSFPPCTSMACGGRALK
jgi:hypothetical protein